MEIRLKKIKIIIFCLVTLSFYRIIINELFTTENIYFKITKVIIITMGLLVISLIVYGLYLQKVFDNKYNSSKKIYLRNRYWKLTTIIIVYILIILYYLDIPFQIWYLVFIIPCIFILLFGLRGNYILLDYNNKLFFTYENYAIHLVKNIGYDKANDSLILDIINEQNMIKTISINKIKNKKTLRNIRLLSEKYNVLNKKL